MVELRCHCLMRLTVTGQSEKDVSTLTTQAFHTKTMTFVATWNVQTLCQYGRLDQVMKEMVNYKIDIRGLCEIRWTISDKMKEDGKTIIYSGHSNEHILGVGLCFSLPVVKALIGWKPVNEHIITARFQTRHAKVTIIQAHPPTMEAVDNKKDNVYKILQNVKVKVPRHDIKVLMGDFNVQIDKSRQGMESTIGPHRSANITNDNGEQFTLFCSLNDIGIGNTFCKHKDIHKTTWLSPDYHTNNEIDNISISSRWCSSLQDVIVYSGADCGSDHFLIIAKM